VDDEWAVIAYNHDESGRGALSILGEGDWVSSDGVGECKVRGDHAHSGLHFRFGLDAADVLCKAWGMGMSWWFCLVLSSLGD